MGYIGLQAFILSKLVKANEWDYKLLKVFKPFLIHRILYSSAYCYFILWCSWRQTHTMHYYYPYYTFKNTYIIVHFWNTNSSTTNNQQQKTNQVDYGCLWWLFPRLWGLWEGQRFNRNYIQQALWWLKSPMRDAYDLLHFGQMNATVGGTCAVARSFWRWCFWRR
jgi:hypothetical protein